MNRENRDASSERPSAWVALIPACIFVFAVSVVLVPKSPGWLYGPMVVGAPGFLFVLALILAAVSVILIARGINGRRG